MENGPNIPDAGDVFEEHGKRESPEGRPADIVGVARESIRKLIDQRHHAFDFPDELQT